MAGWRLVVGAGHLADGAPPAPATGAQNMACDQALLESVADGAPPVLRFYRWQPACLSFGRNQPARGVYDPERARDRGIDLVRRPTGGLAVLHAGELTYAIIAPAACLGGPRAGYARVNGALADGLRSLGVPAELAAGARRGAMTAFAAGHPCFERPAAGEIVAHGRKLVGSAQRVERRTILQHGSILLEGSQAVVRALRADDVGPGREENDSATTVQAVLGRVPDLTAMIEALASACARAFGTALAPAALRSGERTRALSLEARFADPEWTWRR